ncbi:MAG: restriction endonuclease subunit S [Nitrospirota bacterium]
MAGDRLERTTFAKLISDGALEIGDGYRAKNKELGGDGLVFLRAGHVTDTHIDFDGVERFHAELEPRVRSKLARPGDAVITTKGNSTGRTTFVSPSMPPFVYSPHLSYWRSLDPNRIEGGFLRYWCRGSEFTTQLAGMKASTDMAPYLSLVDQKRLEITLPPVREQRAIGHILGSLDDKIELNRRMNETLEAMVRALFKSWFVDFDPVRAKADGRDPGLPKSLADLFPDSFEDSDLGEIPKGWAVSPLRDLAGYLSRGIGPAYVNVGGICVLNQKCVRDRRVDFSKARRHDLSKKSSEGRTLRVLDILVNSTGVGTLGRIAQLWDLPESAIVDSHVTVIRAAEGVDPLFLGIALIGREADVEALGEGSTGQTELSRTRLGELTCLAPPAELQSSFGHLVGPVVSRLSANERVAITVAALRDTLLPKLISGELRVNVGGPYVVEATR